MGNPCPTRLGPVVALAVWANYNETMGGRLAVDNARRGEAATFLPCGSVCEDDTSRQRWYPLALPRVTRAF
jgi:hypothetical protein